MTDPTPPPLPPTPPPESKAASRAVLLTAILAMIGLSIAAWVMASTTDSGTDGEVGDAATGPTGTSKTPTLEALVGTYVALGDSMTSAPLIPEVDRAGGCLRSSQNYPSQLVEALQISDFVDVSCGGATTEDMWASQYTEVPPQLDAVTPDTDLVTLTLGGNDFGTYRNIVIGCARLAARDFAGTPCQDAATAEGGDLLLENIDAIGPRLEDVLSEIHSRAPDALVVLIGYPRLFPSSGTCPETLPFATGDYAYLAAAMERFNDVQRDAATETGTEFLDMHAVSQGHDPCSVDPWMNGEDAVAGGAAAYHPFLEGQAAIAERLVALLDQRLR